MKLRFFTVACLACLALPVLATTLDETCLAPTNTALVKQTMRENVMPASYAPDVSISTFARGTHIEGAAPSRFDRTSHTVWCQARFTVDASAGLDGDTDRGLQMAFARSPGVLAGLQSAFEGPPDKRRYFFSFGYVVQKGSGGTQVRVTGVGQLEAMMTGGLLKAVQARADGPQVAPPPAPVSKPPADDPDKISGN